MSMPQDDMLESAVALAREFGQKTLRPVMREAENNRGVSQELAGQFQETSLDLAGVPEEEGGVGLGVRGRFAVTEALAQGDPALAAALVFPPLIRDLAQRLGISATALALDETHLVFGPSGARGTVVAVGTEGPCLVLSQNRALLLPAGTSMGPGTVGNEAVSHRLITWAEPVEVQELGEESEGCRREALFVILGLLLGAARSAVDYAAAYALGRKAFGQPISAFQGVAFPLADAATLLEAAAALTDRALFFAEQGRQEAGDATVLALVAARQAVFRCGNEAVQTLGGHGFVKEHPVEKWFRDGVATMLMVGPEDALFLKVAQGGQA